MTPFSHEKEEEAVRLRHNGVISDTHIGISHKFPDPADCKQMKFILHNYIDSKKSTLK